MIPVLYKKDERQFRTYGLGEITDIINPKVTRERNGQYLLYFQYPQNAKFSDVFEEDMRIKSDAGVRTKWQTFEISRVIRKEGQLIEVFAKHISQSLLKDALNPEVNVRSSTAQQALRIWNYNRIGDEDFDVWSDISTTSSTSWNIREVSNAFEALAGVQGSILDVWGGEYEFDNKVIRLHKEMGRKSPVPLEYGRNITGLEQDQQDDNVYTSIYPFATYIPEGGADPKTVTLPEYYVDGKYLDMYNKRKIQVVDFSGEFEHDDIPTVTRLRTLAKQYAETNEVGLPHENLKVEYIDLSKTLDYQDFQTMEEVELNDRLPIFYPKFGITNENAKVVAVNYDPVKEENISIELGVIGQSFKTVTTGGIGSRLDRVEKQQDATNNYIVNAKGNRIWFETPDEDMEHKIGDTWFEKNGPYDRIRVWNGNQWEVIIDTEDVDKIAKEVEQAQADIEDTKQKADETAQQIDTAVSNLGFVDLPSALSSFDGQLVTHQETLDGMQSIVYDPERGVTSLNTQLADLVQIAVTGEELSNAITVSEQGILGQVVKNDEVIARINANEEGILLQANKIQALGDVVVDGKLKITDEFIAPKAQIDGAKIADATINSAKINDLDVNKISGNTTSFVSSAWNSNNASVFIDPYGVHSVSGLDTVTLRDGALWLDSNSMDYPTSVLLDGVGLRFATNNKTARMRFNGENLVLDNSLGLYGNHINSVNWLRLIGDGDYETVIHKHPTASGGAIVDSSMLTLGLGTRNSFSSIAQFYGRIDFRRNLHMLGNDIRSVNRVALENSNTHILSHHREAGGVLVDSTRFTVGIGSITTGFNDRLIVTNSQVAIDAHLNMRARRVEQVARLSLSDSSTHLMSLSTGGLLVDGARITIGTGNPSAMDPVARFFGQIHFYKNVYLNGNSIIEGSDERIKENIVDRTEDDLATIMAIDYKNFDMINGNKNQRGFIAQQLQLIDSDLITENNGQLGYNSSNYVHTIGHAVQQLAHREQETNFLASEALINSETNAEKIERLEKRIEELESAA